jgi:hypothetical protein
MGSSALQRIRNRWQLEGLSLTPYQPIHVLPKAIGVA